MSSSPSTSIVAQKAVTLRRKSKRKKIRFRAMAFKLTQGQMDALKKLCNQKNTTPVRFLKTIVNAQVAYYRNAPAPVSYVTENQLELFGPDMLDE